MTLRVIKGGFSLICLGIKKIFYRNQLKFTFFQDLSPTTRISIKGKGEIKLEGTVHTKSNVELKSFNNGKLTIGDKCTFNNNCYIVSGEEINIGDHTIFGPNVVVVDHDHDYKNMKYGKDMNYKMGPIIIGKNVWVGANVVILQNTNIGNNCVIAAGTIIKGNIPDGTLVKTSLHYEFKVIE